MSKWKVLNGSNVLPCPQLQAGSSTEARVRRGLVSGGYAVPGAPLQEASPRERGLLALWKRTYEWYVHNLIYWFNCNLTAEWNNLEYFLLLFFYQTYLRLLEPSLLINKSETNKINKQFILFRNLLVLNFWKSNENRKWIRKCYKKVLTFFVLCPLCHNEEWSCNSL